MKRRDVLALGAAVVMAPTMLVAAKNEVRPYQTRYFRVVNGKAKEVHRQPVRGEFYTQRWYKGNGTLSVSTELSKVA